MDKLDSCSGPPGPQHNISCEKFVRQTLWMTEMHYSGIASLPLQYCNASGPSTAAQGTHMSKCGSVPQRHHAKTLILASIVVHYAQGSKYIQHKHTERKEKKTSRNTFKKALANSILHCKVRQLFNDSSYFTVLNCVLTAF